MDYGNRLIALRGEGANCLLSLSPQSGFTAARVLLPVNLPKNALLVVKRGEERLIKSANGEIRLPFAPSESDRYAVVDERCERVICYERTSDKTEWQTIISGGVKNSDEKRGQEVACKGKANQDAEAQIEAYDDSAIAEYNFYAEENGGGIGMERGKSLPARSLRESVVTASSNDGQSAFDGAIKSVKIAGESMDFYGRIASKIEKIMQTGQKFALPERLIPQSRWVKIGCGKNGYYAVGVIGGKPDFICYGLPGRYLESAPKELDGYCRWLSFEPARPRGEGMWLLYQNAVTGESVRLT